MTYLFSGNNYIDTCQFISTNTGLNISKPSVFVNNIGAYSYENIIDAVLSFSLKEYIQSGINIISVKQNAPLGGNMIIAFPLFYNLPPELVNPINDITLDEDFGSYDISLNNVFFDTDELIYELDILQNTFNAFVENGVIKIQSVDNANGTDKLIVTAKDDEFSTTDTIIVTVNSINDKPLIEGQVFSLDENTATNTFIGNIVYSDPDNNLLTLSIISGNTNTVFKTLFGIHHPFFTVQTFFKIKKKSAWLWPFKSQNSNSPSLWYFFR